MEFMDLPTYVDSMRQGYNNAVDSLLTGMQQMGAAAPGPTPGTQPLMPGMQPGAMGYHQGHDPYRGYGGGCGHPEHYHEYRHDWHHPHRGCGCGHEHDCDHDHDHDGRGCCDDRDHHWKGHWRHRDCRCDCCIVDADIVVFARMGEIRVVPIEVANDTRKVRENVEVSVSEIRSGGGKALPWATLVNPRGPLTLEPCSRTKLELLVHIGCEPVQVPDKADNPTRARGAAKAASETATSTEPLDVAAARREGCPDVECCEVGYTTIRLDGCLIRPIVVAIAVLPLECDAYRAGCSCSCCC
jgi:hypothetical protein